MLTGVWMPCGCSSGPLSHGMRAVATTTLMSAIHAQQPHASELAVRELWLAQKLQELQPNEC